VTLTGGPASELPLAIAEEGALSPDGTHLAYVPHGQWQPAWKHYRGGQTTPIWIADLKDSSVQKIPRENSNDFNPMWVGNTIYFLSDRNGAATMFAYDLGTKQVREAVKNDGFDFKSASAGPDAIVIEQFGALKLYDLNSGQVKDISVRVNGDFPELRPQFVKVEPGRLRNLSLSPAGRAWLRRPGVRSSRFLPTRVISAILRTAQPSPIAIRRGHRMENGSAIFPTSPANTNCRSGSRTEWER
jgi:tricorn protease